MIFLLRESHKKEFRNENNFPNMSVNFEHASTSLPGSSLEGVENFDTAMNSSGWGFFQHSSTVFVSWSNFSQ